MTADALPTPPNESLWYRMSYTPLSDVLRGRWTARLDYRRPLAAANLPAPLDSLVRTVVEKTGLGMGEECEVVRKLIDHFCEGLHSGTTVDELVTIFGDPVHAAKLIRKEIKQERHPLYRIYRRITDADYRRILGQAQLPGPVDALVHTVVRKTRLWRGEKVAIVRELIAHFHDGLQSGSAADELITAFGDPLLAAKLLRIAKKRKRPLVYRACRRTIRTAVAVAAVVLVTYAALAIRFYSGTPRVNRDFAAELNASTASIPDRDRAWPIYKQAYAALTSKEYPRVNPPLPPEPWRAVEFAALCETNSKPLDLFRQAAGKLELGAKLDLDSVELEIVKSYYARIFHYVLPTDVPPRVYDTTIPKFAILCNASDLLLKDAYVGLEKKDAPRILADIEALFGITRHTLQIGGASAQLAAQHNTLGQTEDLMGHLLWQSPQLLSSSDLQSLSLNLAAIDKGGRFKIDTTLDRLEFEDNLQHSYTDDGHGDGRLAGPYGFDLCDSWLRRAFGAGKPNERRMERFLVPLAAAMNPTRREALMKYEALLRESADVQRTPLWLRTDRHDVPVSSTFQVLHYGFVESAHVTLFRSLFLCEIAAQRRDATLVAIALERYRNENGNYPTSLQKLVPKFLTVVPPDRYDGKPLKYKIENGRPLLYSIGADRTDDGGNLPQGVNRRTANWYASEWIAPRDVAQANKNPQRRGDWILWPPVEG